MLLMLRLLLCFMSFNTLLHRLKIKKSEGKGESPLGKFFLNCARSGKFCHSQLAEACHSAGASASSDVKSIGQAHAKRMVVKKNGKLKADTKSVSRAVCRKLQKQSELPEAYIAEGPVWDSVRNCKTTAKFAFLNIHEQLHSLVEKTDPSEWTSISPDQVGYETLLLDSASRLGMAPETIKDTAGIGIWGDSAPFSRKHSVFLLHFVVLTGIFRERFPIVAFTKRQICDCGCLGRCTFDWIFKVIAWMFEALLAKKFPAKDHNGDPFPRGSFRDRMKNKDLNIAGLCIRKFADWAWLKQACSLRGWRGEGVEKKCCWMCGAGFNHQANCYDVSPWASWRSSLMNQRKFLEEVMMGDQRHTSGIWQIPGFVIMFIRPDWMHVADLGVSLTCLGNVLWHCFRKLGGSFNSPKRACSALFNMITVAAREMGVEMPIADLTVGMFRAEAKKKAKARLKAAECRHLIPIVLLMFQTHFRNDEHSNLICLCLGALNDCYLELQSWDGGVSSAKLAAFGRRHVMLFGELSKVADSDRLWSLQPKHHIFVHLCEDSDINPRLEWNYADEDAIGIAAAQSSYVQIPWFSTAWIRRHRLLFRFDPAEGRWHSSR